VVVVTIGVVWSTWVWLKLICGDMENDGGSGQKK
jgi:hypothetical protein